MTGVEKLRQALVGRSLLYLGEEVCLVNPAGEVTPVSPEGQRARIVVLGKCHYYETVRHFPIASLKEVAAAVNLDPDSFCPWPSSRLLLRRLAGDGEQSRVNLWFVRTEVDELLEALAPLVIIPETVLPAFDRQNSLPRIWRVPLAADRSLQVAVDREGAVRSLVGEDSDRSLELFRRAVGGAVADCPVVESKSFTDWLSYLGGFLKTLPFPVFWDFRNPRLRFSGFDRRSLLLGGGGVAVLLLLYALLSSGFLYYTAAQLRRPDPGRQRNIAALLEKKRQIKSLYQRQGELAAVVNGYTPRLALVNLLNRVLPADSVIRRLEVAGDVEMNGLTPRASDLLEILTRKTGVEDVRFLSPLRRDRKSGLEVFHITFVYRRADSLGDAGRP